jgi:hypothetical protein
VGAEWMYIGAAVIAVAAGGIAWWGVRDVD